MKNQLLSIDEVKNEVDRLCEIIDNSKSRFGFVTFDEPSPYAIPFITVDQKGYHFIVYDAGRKIRDDITRDFKELLYWIFDGITFAIAQDFALFTPYKIEWEQRRNRFHKQLELLHLIDNRFEDRTKRRILEVLKRSPFTDGFPNSLEYAEEYLKKSKEDEYDGEPTVAD